MSNFFPHFSIQFKYQFVFWFLFSAQSCPAIDGRMTESMRFSFQIGNFWYHREQVHKTVDHRKRILNRIRDLTYSLHCYTSSIRHWNGEKMAAMHFSLHSFFCVRRFSFLCWHRIGIVCPLLESSQPALSSWMVNRRPSYDIRLMQPIRDKAFIVNQRNRRTIALNWVHIRSLFSSLRFHAIIVATIPSSPTTHCASSSPMCTQYAVLLLESPRGRKNVIEISSNSRYAMHRNATMAQNLSEHTQRRRRRRRVHINQLWV